MSKSQHWYDRDGKAVFEVPKAKGGGTRPTTIADARKLNLYPSVTTVLSVLAKSRKARLQFSFTRARPLFPMLTWSSSGQTKWHPNLSSALPGTRIRTTCSSSSRTS